MARGNVYLSELIKKTGVICFLIQFCISLIANAQENNWPVTVYGGKGASYESAPVIKGYLIVNNKNLNGLVHRTYMKGSSLDTLLTCDTLYGRIKLFVLEKHVDIELSNSNVVSVPCSFIQYIVGTTYDKEYMHIPLTTWVILSPDKYIPFGRLIALRNHVSIYDSSKKDTLDGGFVYPMTLKNGFEEIEISDFLSSTNKTLIKFIKKRYGIDVNTSEENLQNRGYLVDYILEQENILLAKRIQSK
jgi:hypothetical protein